jgi:hypothetical protein
MGWLRPRREVGEVKIGWYYTFCCALDLARIDSEDDLDEAAWAIEELGAQAWPTLDDAARDLVGDPPAMEQVEAIDRLRLIEESKR